MNGRKGTKWEEGNEGNERKGMQRRECENGNEEKRNL